MDSQVSEAPETRRVLVVDDARTVRSYYRSILEGAGIAVDEASNGVEGLEKAGETLPDLFIVDINMPKMDGYTMLRAVRADERSRAVPALMISTEAEGRDEQRAHEAGANVYIVKPVRPDALLGVVRLLLGVAGV